MLKDLVFVGVRIARQPNGKIVFLETGIGGDQGRGLAHILEEHSAEFQGQGIPESDVPEVVMRALAQGRLVLKQGTRDVFKLDFQGRTLYIAVTVGNNGYVVGANPIGRKTFARLLRRQEQ